MSIPPKISRTKADQMLLGLARNQPKNKDWFLVLQNLIVKYTETSKQITISN